MVDPTFDGEPSYVIERLSLHWHSFNSPSQSIVVELSSFAPAFTAGDPDIDLAVIPLMTHLPSGQPNPPAFSVMDLVAAGDIAEDRIGVGTQVAIPGYPDYGGASAERPVLMFGLVSSDLRCDAALGRDTYRNQGLCHSFSTGGMSGSPILTAFGPGPKGDEDPDEPIRVLGVNAGHIEFGAGGPGVISKFVPSRAILKLLIQLGDESARLMGLF